MKQYTPNQDICRTVNFHSCYSAQKGPSCSIAIATDLCQLCHKKQDCTRLMTAPYIQFDIDPIQNQGCSHLLREYLSNSSYCVPHRNVQYSTHSHTT